MHLLAPGFFVAAALLGLPLLLHLLRLHPRQPVPFPSLMFLGREARRDSDRQRIRRWLTFLLRCLAILFIVLAFCRPYWPFEHSKSSRAVVVVVDNSYSMQAAGRRAAVEAWLAPQLASLRAPDQLGVLLLHPSPTWLVPLSADLELGRRALKSLPQGYETSHYRAGLELAGAKLGLSGLDEKQILLAGDQQRAGWSGVRFEHPLPAGVKLFSAPAAEAPKRQAAITALKAARTADGRVALDATVRSFSSARDERTVTFFAGNEKIGEQRVVLADSRPQTVHFESAVPDVSAALMLHATIDADELTVDDTSYVALAATNDRRVLLAAGAALRPGSGQAGEDVDYLGLALGSVHAAKLPAFRVEALPAAGTAWPTSSVALLRGAAPFRGDAVAALTAFLEAGGSAWIVCDGSPEQNAWLATRGVTLAPARSPAGGRLKLRDLALEHPLFAPFAGHSLSPLLAPTFRRGWTLTGAAVEPLARWPDRTIAIAEVPTNGGRLLITGFGDTRDDSTFPIEPGFVPFVHQALSWLAQNQIAAPVGGRVGATLVLPGAGQWRAVLSPKPVAPIDVSGFVTPTVPGLYALEQPEMPQRFYAVNIDPAESDLTPWPTPEDFVRLVAPEKENPAAAAVAAKPAVISVADAALVDERQAWWWLLVAAVVVLLFELALANRTIP